MSKKKNKKVDEGDENNKNDVEENNKEENGGDNPKGEDGEKNEGGGGNGKNAVVLKIDLHCEGCASKVIKRIRPFEGVVNVEVDGGSNKLTVFGKVDPVKLRDALEEKLHKKVEVISPVLKKDGKSKDNGGDNGGKDEKKKESNGKENKNKSDEKKPKEPPVITAVLKVPFHCEGCIQKIHKIVTKAKGYQEMKLDRQKGLVTVTGAIDMKALVESLKKHLKKNVEIVPPKKDEKKDKDNEKEKGKGGCACGGAGQGKVGVGGGGGNRNGKGDGGDHLAGGDGEQKMEIGNKMQVQHGYGHPMMPYAQVVPYAHIPPPGGPHSPAPAPGYLIDPYQQFSYHAPQIFSDENPNACCVM